MIEGRLDAWRRTVPIISGRLDIVAPVFDQPGSINPTFNANHEIRHANIDAGFNLIDFYNVKLRLDPLRARFGRVTEP